jgi:hypothetical protein
MKRNGYKYNEKTQNWTGSSIPQDKQGVYSGGNMSVCAYEIPYKKTIYELI